MTDKQVIAIIGGGAAGLMAAAYAAEICDPDSDEILLVEQNDRMGKKLRITGKGRCNLTNDCDRDEFLQNVPTNPRFLYAALAGFDTKDTQDYFESLGVPLKVERGKRGFPVSDKAVDIVDALYKCAKDKGVKIKTAHASDILTQDGKIWGVTLNDGTVLNCDSVILATGGMSYPLTGSTGDGYKMAEKLGHTVTELKPSLVPLDIHEGFCSHLSGLSLKNVTLSVFEEGKKKPLFSEMGEMLFTHTGISGPLTLSASAHLRYMDKKKYFAEIDLKPALDDKTLDARLLSDFSKKSNKDLINALGDLLPTKMLEPFIAVCGVDARKKVNFFIYYKLN